MRRPRIATLAFVVLVAGCRQMPAFGRDRHALVRVDAAPIAAASPDPSSVATPAPAATPAADPLTPVVVPGIVHVIDFEGTVVLGFAPDGDIVLYDIADGTTTVIATEADDWGASDLTERYVAGTKWVEPRNVPLLYDRSTGSFVSTSIRNAGGIGLRMDGSRLAAVSPFQDLHHQRGFVLDIDTGTKSTFAFDTYRDRRAITGFSGQLLAGWSGADDDGHAWVVDLGSGEETDLQPKVDGYQSWLHGLDGDVVAGATEMHATFVQRAFLYDVARQELTYLPDDLGGTNAWGIDDRWVVGDNWVDDHTVRPFVYDRRSGEMRLLPHPGDGNAGAQFLSGDLVVGGYDGQIVVWDLASLR